MRSAWRSHSSMWAREENSSRGGGGGGCSCNMRHGRLNAQRKCVHTCSERAGRRLRNTCAEKGDVFCLVVSLAPVGRGRSSTGGTFNSQTGVAGCGWTLINMKNTVDHSPLGQRRQQIKRGYRLSIPPVQLRGGALRARALHASSVGSSAEGARLVVF